MLNNTWLVFTGVLVALAVLVIAIRLNIYTIATGSGVIVRLNGITGEVCMNQFTTLERYKGRGWMCFPELTEGYR